MNIKAQNLKNTQGKMSMQEQIENLGKNMYKCEIICWMFISG